jgi:hypothetical protein
MGVVGDSCGHRRPGRRAPGTVAVPARRVRSARRGGLGGAPPRTDVPARVPATDLRPARHRRSLVARPPRRGCGTRCHRRRRGQLGRRWRDSSPLRCRHHRRPAGACAGRRTGRGAGLARGGVGRLAGTHAAGVGGDGDRWALVPVAPPVELHRRLLLPGAGSRIAAVLADPPHARPARRPPGVAGQRLGRQHPARRPRPRGLQRGGRPRPERPGLRRGHLARAHRSHLGGHHRDARPDVLAGR